MSVRDVVARIKAPFAARSKPAAVAVEEAAPAPDERPRVSVGPTAGGAQAPQPPEDRSGA